MRNTTSDFGAAYLQILRAVCRCDACGRKGPARVSRPVFRCLRGKAPFRYEGKEVGIATARQSCSCGGKLIVIREIEGRVTWMLVGGK